jgi:hypothetical protein
MPCLARDIINVNPGKQIWNASQKQEPLLQGHGSITKRKHKVDGQKAWQD